MRQKHGEQMGPLYKPEELNSQREYVEDYSLWLTQDVGGKFGHAANALWQSMDMVIPDYQKLRWLSYKLRDLVDAYEEATCDQVGR